MGHAVDRDHFEEEEYHLFEQRLQQNLAALELILMRPGFGQGATTLGAELEVSIVDSHFQALPVNRQALAQNLDSHIQLELDRFNLEFNLDPVDAEGQPFSTIQCQLENAIARLDKLVRPLGGRVVPIGILPTLTVDQLQADALTDLPRYKALDNGIRRLRQGGPFNIQIDGAEPLSLTCEAVSLEGANTSYQVHLRVNPDKFADTFNAAQLATPVVLSVAANSPTYVGHLLWDETRVALFKQAIDGRRSNPADWRRAARVPFGHGWIRKSALENFAESVALHPCILPQLSAEDPLARLEQNELPSLHELRLHQGTVWQWNRAIYDPAYSGHLRIEMRALPGGPTPVDMAANTALLIGLTFGLRQNIDYLLSRFPFQYADYNFYRAAQDGLDAVLLWPTACGNSPKEIRADELLKQMLPVAQQGLKIIGVSQSEIEQMLALIAQRLHLGISPARWQRRMLSKLDQRMPRSQALARLLQLYLDEAATGKPVSEWTLSI